MLAAEHLPVVKGMVCAKEGVNLTEVIYKYSWVSTRLRLNSWPQWRSTVITISIFVNNTITYLIKSL